MTRRRHPGGRARRDLLAALAGALALLAGLAAARAADPPGPRSRGSADRFVDRLRDGERVSWLYGNVFIDRDTVTARADTGIVYRDRDLFELLGNVVLTSNDAVVTCRRAVYDRDVGSGDFYGGVRLEEGDVVGTGRRGESRRAGRDLRLMGAALLVTPDYSVRADTIYRDRLTGRGEAFGNVRIMEPGAENLVTGDHAVFAGDSDVAEVDRNPVLTSRGSGGAPLHAASELMRFFRAENRVVMTDSVRIRQGAVRARADTAVAYGRTRLVLTGRPEVNRGGGSVMRGRLIEFHYAQGQLRRVILVGDATMEDDGPDSLAALYRGLPRMDVLAGDSISIELEEEEVRRSVVVGHASSRYTPLDLTDEVATNDVEGDTITIHFRQGRAQRVEVRGEMNGVYRFARIAAMQDKRARSRRLADVLARGQEDSLGAGAADSTAAALADSQRQAAVDSLAREAGLELPPAEAAARGRPGVVDSLLAAALDSLAGAGLDTARSELDFEGTAQRVVYSGDAVTFAMRDRKIDIRGSGRLEYDTMVLTAQRIKLDTDERELYAEGEPLVEDRETIAGDLMGYNFSSRAGAVEDGVTAMDEYYYHGEDIKRFEDTTLKIRSGRMTSCDLEEPHYHFWAGKMKMRMDDKVVAAPVVMHVGHVPVFALPFYYKSLKTGRQSGILFPSFDFGWSSREGRYIRDFGYYWATNEYMDFIFEGDYNERRDFGWRVSNRYNKRYAFNGAFDYSAKRQLGEQSGGSEWQFRWNHTQPTLFDDYSFRASVSLASTKLSSNDLAGSNNRDVVNGQLKSNVAVARTWNWGNVNLNGSRDEYPNATGDSQQYNMTAPAVSLGFREFSLLPVRRGTGEGSFLGELGRSTTFRHNYTARMSEQGYELRKARQYNASGNWNLSTQFPRLAIFNLQAGASASQSWSRSENRGLALDPQDSTYVPFDDVEEETTPSVGFNATMGTTLYGLVPVNLGALRTIRHTLILNAGWNLRPALPGHQDHRTSYSFHMGNTFDVKYLSAEGDTALTEKKLDGLVDWDLNTSYDPKAAPGNRWSDISSALSVRPGQARYLQLKVNNTIDPERLALKSTRFTYGLNFSGKVDMGGGGAAPEARRSDAIDRLGLPAEAPVDSLADDPYYADGDAFGRDPFLDEQQGAFDDYERRPANIGGKQTRDPTEGGRYLPFDFGTNVSFAYTNRFEDRPATKRASAGANFKVNLTQNWSLNWTASFDLDTGTTIRQQYRLQRDLHCWRLEFTRTVSTVDSQFGFRLYLLTIPELKFTRGREDYMGAVGSGLY